ncbi:choice-of-anchor D domain-containing protein [Jatrophihabitans sp.]|uniref:Ig-like domain-containing protein n=1 Tax=Jatrophihabitans sp. TaxID=1932789 RepID=UPI0030C708C6|nr:legume lectin beta domain protein [Jatrophihabitans sp.]
MSRAASPPTQAEAPTGGGSTLRNGWYADEEGLSPQLITSTNFGQLFSTPVNGQVYAQPLLTNGTVLVATMTDWLYGLDPVTGAIRWARQIGSAYDSAPLGCGDITPSVGVLSTPTIDPATGIAYVMAASYRSGVSGPVSFYLHAINPADGREQAGFPVEITGSAQNDPSLSFAAIDEWQRPALLLLDGVVYASFAGHCDGTPYQGWISGVSTTGHLTTLWTSAGPGLSGAGIWQSGGGLVSDGPGQIMFSSGNGADGSSPSGTIPGSEPPANLSESVVRLGVQPDGSLKAEDFFTPYDAKVLDDGDLDFGSGAPIALPSQFGTPSIPHLSVAVGKEGYVYLLDRDNLGGTGTGPGGGDGSLDRLGPNGGVWSTPAAWPGDGGYVYIPTASGGPTGRGSLITYQYGVSATGSPTLQKVATSDDGFAFGSSAPVITSDGTTSGSAVLWIVRRPDATGANAELQAYNPVPVNGVLTLLAEWPVGTSSKFNPPGVGGNRLYVGTQDGHVHGFGAPVSSSLTGSGATFPATVVGQSKSSSVRVTARSAVDVTSASSSSSAFSVDASALPLHLGAGQSLTLPVTFAPNVPGDAAATLTLGLSIGQFQLAVSGVGLSATGYLVAQSGGLSLGGAPTGTTLSGSLRFTNLGATSLTVTGVSPPSAPFSATGLPVAGTASATIAPDTSFTASIAFRSAATGTFSDALKIVSTGGTVDVTITAVATTPSVLVVKTTTVAFGSVAVGSAVTRSFTVQDVGGSPITLVKSKPPIIGPFVADTGLAEGTTLDPGETRTLLVTFEPDHSGNVTDHWVLNGDATQGLITVTFSGTGTGAGVLVPASAGAGRWSANGSAVSSGSGVELTPATQFQAGSAVYPAPVAGSSLVASFDLTTAEGDGGDGTALLLQPAAADPTRVGGTGWGVGYSGLSGVAVVFGEYPDPGAPGPNYVGVADGIDAAGTGLNFEAIAQLNSSLQNSTIHVTVVVSGTHLRVLVNGVSQLAATIAPLPASVLPGFSAGTGALTNAHSVSNTRVVSTALPRPTLTAAHTLAGFGNVSLGTASVKSLTLAAVNGPVTISRSAFTGTYGVQAASVIPAGTVVTTTASLAVRVLFQPMVDGHESATWAFTTSSGQHLTLRWSGTGTGTGVVAPALGPAGWQFNGGASVVAGGARLTPAAKFRAGSVFAKKLIADKQLGVSFNLTVGKGPGADGTALVLAAPSTRTSAVGGVGWGVGYAGISGLAVVFGEFPDVGAPSGNYVALASGTNAKHNGLHFLATAKLSVALAGHTAHVQVSVRAGTVKVYVNGVLVLSSAGHKLASTTRLGFTAGTGAIDDSHGVTSVRVVSHV